LCAREIGARQAAKLAGAAEGATASFPDAMLRWQRSVKFSVRGRSIDLWARDGAAAHGMRGREFSWLTIFDSKRLRKDKPARRRGRHVPHAIPVMVHKNIGLKARERRTMRETPRNRLRPRNPSHRVSGSGPCGEPAGCPNVAQPEL
jgi:hypothetical protein